MQTAQFGTVWSPYHEGGIIRAHSGLNLTPDEIPIIVQTGERILSRSQNKDYEKESKHRSIYITVNPTAIIKVYDFADFYAHKEEFEAMMTESIDLNKLRKAINANH
jgi:benzoyl-CoA reductase/2-hydroxyglutaryl-CoA dehydratase subunit BcrC/BadD/HgdB